MSSDRTRRTGRRFRRDRVFTFIATLVLCSSLGSLAIAADIDAERQSEVSASPSREEPAMTSTPAAGAGAFPDPTTEPTVTPIPTPTTAPAPSPAPTTVPTPEAVAPPPAPAAPDCSVLACVALTFDDGPGAETGRLLDVLAAKGVHATFFVLGGATNAHPDLVAREVAEGHAVGNHTWDHRDLTKLTDAEIDGELAQTRDAVAAASGFTPTMVRPPYGNVDDRVAGRVAAIGDSMVLWNIDSEDWKSKDAAATTQRVLDTVKPGGIVLLHDIHSWTVDAVPGIVDALRAAGYTLVTVPELLGGDPAPGTRHYSR